MIEAAELSENNVQSVYWHTLVKSIKIYKEATDSEIKKAIIEEDRTADCARFGVDENGDVFWWNGSVNHSGVATALQKMWILTGFWNFDKKVFLSNNKYSQKQLDSEAQTPEGKKTLDTLRNFSTNIRTIEMASAILRF